MAETSLDIRDWTIYKLTSPTERVYVGVTVNFKRRMRDYELNSCKNQKGLLHSLAKYGFSAHKVEVLEQFTSDCNHAHSKEIFWIRSYMCNYAQFPKQNGLNLTRGGMGALGAYRSPEYREKISKTLTGRKLPRELVERLTKMKIGKKINRVFTPEQRKEISEKYKKKGFTHTEESKRKIGEAALGNKYSVGVPKSEEFREATRKRATGNTYSLGRVQSQEEKDKRAASLRGRKHTPEAIAGFKIGARKRGRPVLVYDLSMNFLHEFPVKGDAAEYLKCHVSGIKNVLNGRFKQWKGYIFKFK